MNDLLIIIPVYNEEIYIEKSYNAIRSVSRNCKIMYVDDGSTDKSIHLIRNLEKNDVMLYHISFSKNFGKEASMMCGLKESSNFDSKYTCLMDVDGQDPFALIIRMYNILNNSECDAVACRRKDRIGEKILRSYLSDLFYKINNKLLKNNITAGARDFIMMNNTFRDAILLYNEKCRFFKGLYTSIGYNLKWIEYSNVHIDGRKSKWTILQLMSYAIDSIVSYTSKFLIVSVWFGFIFCVISFILMMIVFLRTAIFGDKVQGWTSLMCIILFSFGLLYLFIGILGLYLSKGYDEVKNRPLYIIKGKSDNFPLDNKPILV